MSSHTPARTQSLDTQPSLRPQTSLRPRTSRHARTRRRILAVTSLGLAGFLAGLLTGCGTGVLPSTSAPGTSYAQAAGNWQFSSPAAAATRLPSVGGALTVSGSNVTGMLHPVATSPCLGSSTTLLATGTIDAASRLTLTAPLPGGSLNLAGTLSADGRSLASASYTISGGACASPATSASSTALQSLSPKDTSSTVTAQQFQPVSGTYAGTLTTAEGETFALSSTLTQTSAPDADGVYHVTGSAASPGNPCVPASLSATASAIDGGAISTTYTDPITGSTIAALGVTSPDASTITISSWTINSPCGSDTGTGTLTRQ